MLIFKVRSHGATSRRDMLQGHVARSESHEATMLCENKLHKRLYALVTRSDIFMRQVAVCRNRVRGVLVNKYGVWIDSTS